MTFFIFIAAKSRPATPATDILRRTTAPSHHTLFIFSTTYAPHRPNTTTNIFFLTTLAVYAGTVAASPIIATFLILATAFIIANLLYFTALTSISFSILTNKNSSCNNKHYYYQTKCNYTLPFFLAQITHIKPPVNISSSYLFKTNIPFRTTCIIAGSISRTTISVYTFICFFAAFIITHLVFRTTVVVCTLLTFHAANIITTSSRRTAITIYTLIVCRAYIHASQHRKRLIRILVLTFLAWIALGVT
jgi:hypothetical protein